MCILILKDIPTVTQLLFLKQKGSWIDQGPSTTLLPSQVKTDLELSHANNLIIFNPIAVGLGGRLLMVLSLDRHRAKTARSTCRLIRRTEAAHASLNRRLSKPKAIESVKLQETLGSLRCKRPPASLPLLTSPMPHATAAAGAETVLSEPIRKDPNTWHSF